MRVWLTPRNTQLPTHVTMPNLVILDQTILIIEIHQKEIDPHIPPVNVTHGHWNQCGWIT